MESITSHTPSVISCDVTWLCITFFKIWTNQLQLFHLSTSNDLRHAYTHRNVSSIYIGSCCFALAVQGWNIPLLNQPEFCISVIIAKNNLLTEFTETTGCLLEVFKNMWQVHPVTLTVIWFIVTYHKNKGTHSGDKIYLFN